MSHPGTITGVTTVASSASSFALWGLNASEAAVITSAVVAVLTFALHCWYTIRKDARAQRLFERQIDGANSGDEGEDS